MTHPSRFWLAPLLWLALAGFPASADQQRTLVIIIDDIGNNLESGIRTATLPGKLNLAILPDTPNSAKLADLAAALGKEVVLHAPMSNLRQRPLGPCALTSHMEEQELRHTLVQCIERTPHVKGVSNHMGSQLTSMRTPMEWVMQELATRGLYYIDSRTSKETVAASVAEEYGIPHLSRQVFLDNEASTEAIHAQFQELLGVAEADGIAVAVGHPYPETINYLQEVLPTLSASGYHLALISEVLAPARQPEVARSMGTAPN
jgi:polysaccharide deacetylase 2 family uncharacterized protein YibQ